MHNNFSAIEEYSLVDYSAIQIGLDSLNYQLYLADQVNRYVVNLKHLNSCTSNLLGSLKKFIKFKINKLIFESYKCSKWLWLISRISRLIKHPMALGRLLILFSRKLSIVNFSKFLMSSLTFRMRLNRKYNVVKLLSL